jgi:AcrR family transcriptional regulator
VTAGAASPAEPLHALQEELPARQEALVRKTYRLIGTRGMQRTTLQAVADAAGVSKAVIVYHFKSKENLVLTTMRWVLGQTAVRIRASLASAESPEDKVRAMIDAIFRDAVRNRNFYLAYTDLIAHAARNRRFNRLNETFRSIVNEAYAEVVRAGLGGPFRVGDVDEAAMGVRALIDGLFLQWLEEPDWRRRHGEYREICVRAVLAFLGGRPATRARTD